MGNFFSMGFKGLAKGKPEGGRIVPNVMEAMDFDSQKKYSDIKEDERDQFSKVVDAEERRQGEWDALIQRYDSMSDEMKVSYLLSATAKRLGLVQMNYEEGTYNLIEPKQGVVFRAMVSKRPGSAHFNLESVGKWDKEHKTFPIYSTLNVKDAEEENIELAKKILKAVNAKKKDKE
jgi:hypothetical protein